LWEEEEATAGAPRWTLGPWICRVGGVILDLPCVRREERRVWRRRLARDEEKSDLGLGWNNGKGARGVFVVAWDEEKKCERG
jgi:hypothetical protein